MPREEKQHKIEVHVAGVCFRETEADISILIVKRRDDRELYPGKWECGGGQIRSGENFEEAIKRQIKEELGIITERVLVFGTYQIATPQSEQKIIPGVKFICFWKEYVNGEGPKIDPKEHIEWKWISINNTRGIDFIPGLGEDIRIAWEFYSNNQNIFSNLC
jgi:8-oxo-dGTP pyrophosphatase MutT (NUDIX family)